MLLVDDEPNIEITEEGKTLRKISRRELEHVWGHIRESQNHIALSALCPSCNKPFTILYESSPGAVPPCPYCGRVAKTVKEYEPFELMKSFVNMLINQNPTAPVAQPDAQAKPRRPIEESVSRVFRRLTP